MVRGVSVVGLLLGLLATLLALRAWLEQSAALGTALHATMRMAEAQAMTRLPTRSKPESADA